MVIFVRIAIRGRRKDVDIHNIIYLWHVLSIAIMYKPASTSVLNFDYGQMHFDYESNIFIHELCHIVAVHGKSL